MFLLQKLHSLVLSFNNTVYANFWDTLEQKKHCYEWSTDKKKK